MCSVWSYSGAFCSSCVLFAFSDLFRWLLFEEAFNKAIRCVFVSLAALLFLALESRFTLFRDFTGELWQFFVSLISFADPLWLLLFEEAFIKVMKLLVSILEADCLHILESTREVSFDRSMVDLQKIRPVRYIMRFHKPTCSFFTLTSIKPNNQHLNQKMIQLVIIYCMYFIHSKCM